MKSIITLLLLASSALAWDCPAPYKKISESNGFVYCGITVTLTTVEQGPMGLPGPPGKSIVGPRGPAGQSIVGPQGPVGPAYVPTPPPPIPWEGWTALNGATATPSADDSRILVRCPLVPGICGFTHGLEGSMTVKIRPSFDPQWGSAWFGIYSAGSVEGLLNMFSQHGWSATTRGLTGPNILPRNDEYWVRTKDGTVDYSSDGILWYPQTPASGDQVFLGCWNGGAFWVLDIQ